MKQLLILFLLIVTTIKIEAQTTKVYTKHLHATEKVQLKTVTVTDFTTNMLNADSNSNTKIPTAKSVRDFVRGIVISGSTNIYNSNGSLTANRTITLNGFTLSHVVGANTVERTFANGRKWFGNGTAGDSGYQVEVVGAFRARGGSHRLVGADTSINSLAFRIENSQGLNIASFFNNGFVSIPQFTSSFINGGSQTLTIQSDIKSAPSIDIRYSSALFQNNTYTGLRSRQTFFINSGQSTSYTGFLSSDVATNNGGTLNITGFLFNPEQSGTGTWNYIGFRNVVGNNFFNETAGTTVFGSTSLASNNSILELNSTTKGFLPPRLTATQASALPVISADEGLTIYVTSTNATFLRKGIYTYTGTSWQLNTDIASNFYFTDGLEASNDSTARLTNTSVTPGTYGSATQVAQFTVDQKGRITNATNVTITGGGGGNDQAGFPDKSAEFLNTNAVQGEFIGAAISSGTNSTAVSGTISNADHPGVVLLRSSTTANSGYYYMTSSASNNTLMVLKGGEQYDEVFRTTASFTNTTVRLGYPNTTSSTIPLDGVWLEYIGNGQIVGRTGNAGAYSTTATIVTLAADTWYHARITVSNDRGAITYQVYNEAGTLLGSSTLTTTIPASDRQFRSGLIATNSGTTATDLIYLDFQRHKNNQKLQRGNF